MEGYINFLKAPGNTSHQCVAFFRKMLGMKKIGHAGTLDPGAAGVLPICLGKGTKAADYLLESSKIYRAELYLGVTTDTQDAYGKITGGSCFKDISEERVREIFGEFRGKITQVPPMYSAVKHKGKPLYKLARQGEVIPRKAREVMIYSLEILDINLPRVLFQVECSKGTYVRTLAVDIGERLGTGAYLSFLLRVKSGPFMIEESYTQEELEVKMGEGNIQQCILPLDYAYGHFPDAVLKEEALIPFINGVPQPLTGLKNYSLWDKILRVYSPEGTFLALGEWQTGCSQPMLKPKKIFRQG
ncbi:tRNA pseudouridine(55) synthase TruB [Candidatus Contubernalis alkaliaceticus]|uniref:tRNA pseudouridine(55) synthase TruB n=1 Tax=Candidatus Contubernalis alkaliaceticus TaxID=338645 RepID=UPI001F4C2A82|nr:tRNA pseudouridine(55) synthase TruB [Candidatus Contubernalis alkalaceticus]UNC91840.1 tRNA pseudouridine(55) synthase TruB [Candidatus Contubernalis alkalaceticus]